MTPPALGRSAWFVALSLDEGFHREAVLGILRIAELQRVAQLRDAVLDLDPRVHFHEEVLVPVHDTFEGGHGVEAHGRSEARRLVLHLDQRLQVLRENRRLRVATLRQRLLVRALERLDGDGDFEQLLFVHLQRAVATAQGHAPVAVADHLDFLVPRGLDVELHENVLVVAHARRFHLGEDLANELRRTLGLADTDDPLTLSAAATDGLQAHPVAGVIPVHALHGFRHRLAEFIDRVQIDALFVSGGKHLIGGRLDVVIETIGVQRETLLVDQFAKGFMVRVALEERERRCVVDAGRDRDAGFQRCALGFVLEPGVVDRARTGTDEIETGLLHGGDHGLVLGHEAVARKDGVVVVCPRDADDLADALLPLLLVGARVVGHAVNALGIVDDAQFRCERVLVHDRVFLRKQDADVADPHLAKNVDGFLAYRTAADDQGAHVRAVKLCDPARVAPAQAPVAVNQWIVEVVLVRQGPGSQAAVIRRQ